MTLSIRLTSKRGRENIHFTQKRKSAKLMYLINFNRATFVLYKLINWVSN